MINKRKVFIFINPNIINKNFFINTIKKHSESRYNYFIFTSKIKKINNFWDHFIKNNKNVFFVTKYNKFLYKNKIFKKIKKCFVFSDRDLDLKLNNKKIFYINIKELIKLNYMSLTKIKLEKIIFNYMESCFPKNLPVILVGNNMKDWEFINQKQEKKKITIKI